MAHQAIALRHPMAAQASLPPLVMLPNAGRQAPLEAVACTPLFGPAYLSDGELCRCGLNHTSFRGRRDHLCQGKICCFEERAVFSFGAVPSSGDNHHLQI